MVEKEYKLSTSNEKAIEKVIFDENLHYLHMVFNKGEGLPEKFGSVRFDGSLGDAMPLFDPIHF